MWHKKTRIYALKEWLWWCYTPGIAQQICEIMCCRGKDILVFALSGPTDCTNGLSLIYSPTPYSPFPPSNLFILIFSQIHKNPRQSRQVILDPKAKEAIPVCWCKMPICPAVFGKYKHPSGCRNIRYFEHLSDHQPVLGEFLF